MHSTLESIQVLIGQWGYLGILVFVLLGNLGLPVPEESVLWVAGYLVWQGGFQLPLVLLVGIVSAVAGDSVGYWIGRRYGPSPSSRGTDSGPASRPHDSR